jgi:hypothetical protein
MVFVIDLEMFRPILGALRSATLQSKPTWVEHWIVRVVSRGLDVQEEWPTPAEYRVFANHVQVSEAHGKPSTRAQLCEPDFLIDSDRACADYIRREVGYLDFEYSVVVKVGDAVFNIGISVISRRCCHFNDGGVIRVCFTPPEEYVCKRLNAHVTSL